MKIRFIFLLLLLIGTGASFGQKLTLGFIYPAGGERGTAFEVEIGGLNISNANEVIISGEGVKAEVIKNENVQKQKRKSTKLDDQSSPQLAERIKIRVHIDKNATLGLRDFRLSSESGISNKLSFEIGQYPNFTEEHNPQINKVNILPKLPITVCGQILPAEVDKFTFTAKKGSKLVINTKARLLIPFIADAVPGWFQPVIELTDSKGKSIAYNDDYRFEVDPKIVTEIAETDTFTLSIHDAIFRGREDFTYRIDIGEIPHLDYVFPCVAYVDKKTTVRAVGTNLKSSEINVKPTTEGFGVVTTQNKKGEVSNPVPFFGLNKESKLELCPIKNFKLDNNTLIFDSIITAYQAKTYRIEATKNEVIAVEVIARRLGSLIDARLILKDKNDSILMISDDVEDQTQGLMTFHADPLLRYKVKETGTYFITIEDVLENFGKDYFYLLQRKKNTSAYDVFISPANFSIPQGGTSVIRLDISSTEKITPSLNIEIEGLPENYKASSLKTQIGARSWDISITAPENAENKQLNLHLFTSTTNANNNVETKKVEAVDNMMQAFYYTHRIPAASLVAEVKEPSAFSIHLTPEIENDLSKPIALNLTDTIIPLKIIINRKPGFNDEIQLSLTRKSKIITMETSLVEAGESEKTIYLKIDKQLLKKGKTGKIQLSISGSVKPVVDTKGKKRFENAKYKEVTPVFMLERTSY